MGVGEGEDIGGDAVGGFRARLPSSGVGHLPADAGVAQQVADNVDQARLEIRLSQDPRGPDALHRPGVLRLVIGYYIW